MSIWLLSLSSIIMQVFGLCFEDMLTAVTISYLFRMLSHNQTSEKPYSFRIGNLILNSIGQLLPHQVQAFHTRDSVYPVGFSTTRIYWSMRVVGRRCRYQCHVKDVNGDPHFVVKVEEEGYEELSFDARTPRGKFVFYPGVFAGVFAGV